MTEKTIEQLATEWEQVLDECIMHTAVYGGGYVPQHISIPSYMMAAFKLKGLIQVNQDIVRDVFGGESAEVIKANASYKGFSISEDYVGNPDTIVFDLTYEKDGEEINYVEYQIECPRRKKEFKTNPLNVVRTRRYFDHIPVESNEETGW